MDVALFRFINGTLANPVFDWLMPQFGANRLFIPLVIVVCLCLLWKGGARGWLFVSFLLLALAIGDGMICASLKHGINRPRPFESLENVRILLGRGAGESMPSSHAANWFAAVAVTFVYYRRALAVILPTAVLVAFSRIYTGMHYPSDVLAGVLLGLAYATGIMLLAEFSWKNLGCRWFPKWFAQQPSLLHPVVHAPSPALVLETPQWVRLGYLVIGAILVGRLIYQASGKIQLSEDEAYQWIWSKHLDLSYFSKPPLIAYIQFLGTSIAGDTAFGVRFLSPIMTAIGSIIFLRFLAREVNGRAAFWFIIVTACTPLLGVGATLMTIDPPSALFWALAIVAGWNAIQRDSMAAWLVCGLCMAFGFLAKYIGLFQVLSWLLFFALWKPARAQLRKPGFYLALGVLALSLVPVIVWNARHDWIGASHLADRGGFHQRWSPTLRYFWDFVGAEFALLNPVFFVATMIAAWQVWRRKERDPLELLFWCMSVPLFLFYFVYTLKSRVHPNWIAPSVLPMLAMMVIFFEKRWRSGSLRSEAWLKGGAFLGLFVVILLHDTRLIGKIAGVDLPPKLEPLRRVWGWNDTADAVQAARRKLLQEGKGVFIIGSHYGIVGLLSFYIPEAKEQIRARPIVYYMSTEKPDNQFYFWPGYGSRKGENAIFVMEVDQPGLVPERLKGEFKSITDLGVHDIKYRGKFMRRLQLFECRELL